MSRAGHIVCPACGSGELRPRVLTRCDSCGSSVEGVVFRTLEQIAALPEVLDRFAKPNGSSNGVRSLRRFSVHRISSIMVVTLVDLLDSQHVLSRLATGHISSH
jgi:hypothetical protein